MTFTPFDPRIPFLDIYPEEIIRLVGETETQDIHQNFKTTTKKLETPESKGQTSLSLRHIPMMECCVMHAVVRCDEDRACSVTEKK